MSFSSIIYFFVYKYISIVFYWNVFLNIIQSVKVVYTIANVLIGLSGIIQTSRGRFRINYMYVMYISAYQLSCSCCISPMKLHSFYTGINFQGFPILSSINFHIRVGCCFCFKSRRLEYRDRISCYYIVNVIIC